MNIIKNNLEILAVGLVIAFLIGGAVGIAVGMRGGQPCAYSWVK